MGRNINIWEWYTRYSSLPQHDANRQFGLLLRFRRYIMPLFHGSYHWSRAATPHIPILLKISIQRTPRELIGLLELRLARWESLCDHNYLGLIFWLRVSTAKVFSLSATPPFCVLPILSRLKWTPQSDRPIILISNHWAALPLRSWIILKVKSGTKTLKTRWQRGHLKVLWLH